MAHKDHFAPYGEAVLGSYISVFVWYRKLNLTLQLPTIATTGSAHVTDMGEEVDRIYNLSFSNEIPGTAEDEFAISLDTPIDWTPLFLRGVDHGTFNRPVFAMLYEGRLDDFMGLSLRNTTI